ncbi:MAG: hypothetical protein JXA37_03145 [Chloroflexia bacterium]|nr:hypothetical protein [Chloroflexia bacterium]
MDFRTYDPEKDQEAVHRIWRETGWLQEDQEEIMDLELAAGRTLLACLRGEPECLVSTMPGHLRYLEEDLPFAAVIAVTTSRIARRRGLAGRLTAQAVALDATEGALVAGLGMFEQGYYNQLGFGTGGYELWAGFDPARIRTPVKPRLPERIDQDDWAEVHACRLARRRGHGACNLLPPASTRAEMQRSKKGFGLGYHNGADGSLSHFFWCEPRDVERGPYSIYALSYQRGEQFLELLALLRNLGDQVRLVRMREPPGIQLQDLIDKPFKQRQVSQGSKFESTMRATAYWQMRICDLPGCLARTHLPGEPVRFNLQLHDPIERYLGESAPWRGQSGDYVVTLGPASIAETGTDRSLPRLRASVGAFSRLWLGVRPADGLAITDELAGPVELLQKLDRLLRLPQPKPDWDF